MMISAIVAVALGVAPVKRIRMRPQLVQVDEAKIAAQIGRYRRSQAGMERPMCAASTGSVDRTISRSDSKGHVTGEVGNLVRDLRRCRSCLSRGIGPHLRSDAQPLRVTRRRRI